MVPPHRFRFFKNTNEMKVSGGVEKVEIEVELIYFVELFRRFG